MNFCRRCGAKLTRQVHAHHYVCENGHTIFGNASPAIGVIIMNDKREVLLLRRAIDPGKGKFDVPGGFCDGAETAEAAIIRELKEEVGLSPGDYETPRFVLSGIDTYDYGGETIPVLSLVYVAAMKTSKRPVAADDAASADWVPLHEVDTDEVYFPSIRAGIQHVQTQ